MIYVSPIEDHALEEGFMKRRDHNCSWILLAAMILTASCGRKAETPAIVIEVNQSQSGAAYINGYRKTLDGQVLPYHSSHPDADSALLVRANREAPSISWETDPLPETTRDEFYELVWLAGLEREGWPGKEVHKFDFYVNGERWFTFQNLKDENANNWRASGKQGAELSFQAATVDRVGDLFGYMRLRVPRSEVKPGAPLTLRVTGQDADSVDWYMTLQYAFRFTPSLRAEPALAREAGEHRQYLRLSFDNLQEGRSMTVSLGGSVLIKQKLDIGANINYVSVPAADSEHEIPVVFKINGAVAERTTLRVKPVKRREIYLLSYSHNDIGYTDLQPAIEKKQWQNLDQALQLIHQTEKYPPDARFKWNLEVMWPLEGYLQQASEQKRQEVIQAIRSGSIGLNALYANELTGLASAAEMNHFTEYARRITAQYQVPITTALVSDVPGFSWGIVSALAHSGVKYFASAPNTGDRIGYVLQDWGDKPFYWKSQSGGEKVLMWVAGAGYSSFHEGDLTRLGDEKLLKLMRKLDDSGYPYEILQLPYTVGGDNGTPDPNLPDFVKKWNERYDSPRLIIATHARMFSEFEKRYGTTLPAYQGDFTPYWEDGAASTALETALNRRAVDGLIQGEALWAMTAPKSFPEREYQDAWRNVVLWDEHTWGAHNSIDEPDLPFVREQWRIKRQFAIDAGRMSSLLLGQLETLINEHPTEMGPEAFDVYNTNSWPRTDLVLLSVQNLAAGDSVFDEKGVPVRSQRLSTGELAILAENIPPFSARRFFVKPGKADNRGSCRVSQTTLSNSLLSLAIDSKTGAIQSLTWGEKKTEWVDGTKGGLDQYMYVLGKDAAKARGLSHVRVGMKENGNLVASLLVEGEAPGCKSYTAEYRIIDGMARVDIIDRLDKRAVREKEAVHIAFPFSVSDGQLRYDVAYGVVRPELDQLKGSCKNFFSTQSWVDISNGDRGITWASPDAPLIEIGSITAEQPWARTTQSSGLIYSYLMNNYWHTNYKADQEGKAEFRYSILPHAGFRPEAAVRFGRETRQPLLELLADTAIPVPAPLFRLQPPEIVVFSLEPLAGGGGWLVGLYNPTGTDREAVLDWGQTRHGAMYLSDDAGHAGPRVAGSLKLAPWGSAFVRVDR
jgi:hypothetical protein